MALTPQPLADAPTMETGRAALAAQEHGKRPAAPRRSPAGMSRKNASRPRPYLESSSKCWPARTGGGRHTSPCLRLSLSGVCAPARTVSRVAPGGDLLAAHLGTQGTVHFALLRHDNDASAPELFNGKPRPLTPKNAIDSPCSLSRSAKIGGDPARLKVPLRHVR
jgi:hypothetical protein